jgi:hypothetical protein
MYLSDYDSFQLRIEFRKAKVNLLILKNVILLQKEITQFTRIYVDNNDIQNTLVCNGIKTFILSIITILLL